MSEDSLFSTPSPSFVICRICNEGHGSDFFFMLIVTLLHIFVVCMYVSSHQFLVFSICSTHPPSDLEYSLYFFKENLSSISLFSFVHLYKDLECLFFIYLVSPPHTFHCQFLCATLGINFHGQIF